VCAACANSIHLAGRVEEISAELKKESEEKQGRRMLRSERQYGFASRSFTLASDIDDDASTAKVENGVPELKLPKRSKASSRKLNVS
jgi:HSP20 family protein